MRDFRPPLLLRNRHMQTILNSLKLRKPFVNRRAKSMLKAARSHILECGQGVRLQGFLFSAAGAGKRLVHSDPWMGRKLGFPVSDVGRRVLVECGI
jgi:uncharacterized protein